MDDYARNDEVATNTKNKLWHHDPTLRSNMTCKQWLHVVRNVTVMLHAGGFTTPQGHFRLINLDYIYVWMSFFYDSHNVTALGIDKS